MTRNKILIAYLEYVNDWIPAHQLRSHKTPFGFLGFQSDRRCRELAAKGLIDRRVNGKFVEYRAKVEPNFMSAMHAI